MSERETCRCGVDEPETPRDYGRSWLVTDTEVICQRCNKPLAKGDSQRLLQPVVDSWDTCAAIYRGERP